MTIDEARAGKGRRVRYQPPGGKTEYGVLTGFNTLAYAFVQYDGDQHSKATRPEELEFVW